MTLNETKMLYEWLSNSYPRNYKNLDQRAAQTALDNLAYTFRGYAFQDVLAEYRHRFTSQKTEPHPSEIRAALKQETRQTVARASVDPLQSLKQHSEWDQLCRAYGEKEVKRQAKLCVETGTIGELKFRLERDQ